MATMEGAPGHGTVAHLLPQTYKRLVAEWLEEDTPSFDYGGFVVGDDLAEAKLLGKSEVCFHFSFSILSMISAYIFTNEAFLILPCCYCYHRFDHVPPCPKVLSITIVCPQRKLESCVKHVGKEEVPDFIEVTQEICVEKIVLQPCSSGTPL